MTNDRRDGLTILNRNPVITSSQVATDSTFTDANDTRNFARREATGGE